MEKYLKDPKLRKASLWIIGGILLVAYVLSTCGFSVFVPITFEDSVQAEEHFNAHGKWYNPFCSLDFAEVIPSGLYLFEEGSEETPTDWVLYGDFGDRWVAFLTPAAKGATDEDFPEEQYEVNYILRYPTTNAEYVETVQDGLLDMAVSDGYYNEAEYYSVCSSAVYETARSDKTINMMLFFVGIAFAVIGVFMLMKAKNAPETDEFATSTEASPERTEASPSYEREPTPSTVASEPTVANEPEDEPEIEEEYDDDIEDIDDDQDESI